MTRTQKPSYYELLAELKTELADHAVTKAALSSTKQKFHEAAHKTEVLREYNIELILELVETHEDRKILAKQLRDERSFASALCEALLDATKTLREKQERIDQLEYELWEATSPEVGGINDFFEDPDQWAARHGLY